MHTLKTRISIITGFVLLLNGVVYCDFPLTLLSGNLVATHKEFLPAVPRIKTGVKRYIEENHYYDILQEHNASKIGEQVKVLEEKVSDKVLEGDASEEVSEEKKEFIPAEPRLAQGVKTYINRNGFTVFHGYRYSDIPGNTHLSLAREKMVNRNSQRRYTGGASNFRTTNYRKTTYASDMYASASDKNKINISRKSLSDRKEIGYSREVQPQKTRIQRYSLRQSLQDEGVAVAFQRAKEQKNLRNELHSEEWAQNRTQREDPALMKDRSRIDVKQADSRRALLDYYEQKKIEREEFEAEIQRELNGETEEEEE